MKKTLTTLCILILAVGVLGAASADACGEKKVASNATSCSTKAASSTDNAACSTDKAACSQKKVAATNSGCCPTTAAKAAYASTLESSGCEKTAKAAYINAMAETAYNNSLTEKHCSATAAKAAYAVVKEETGCTQTAAAACQHAVAKAAYDQSLTATGCAETAEKAYDEAALAAASEVEEIAKTSAVGDDS